MELSTDATKIADVTKLSVCLGSPITSVMDNKPASLIAYKLPDLVLSSGRITACDGFIMDGMPFTRTVDPGRYPLFLIAERAAGDERIAFALLQFADTPIATWEMATLPDQLVTQLEEDEIFGYGVDSGTGCLCDENARKLIELAYGAKIKFYDRLADEMKRVYRHTRTWVHIETDGGSAALFSSGLGDGVYASYFALDQTGRPVALLTDFGIVDWPKRPL